MSGKRRYSPNESKLLQIMSERKGVPITAKDLCDLFFDDGNEHPYFAHHQINATMRSLMLKIDHNAEKFGIEKSKRDGPKFIKFWYVEKINRKKVTSG